MASPTARGRMIRRSISESVNFSRLSAEAAVLFVLLVPHFNAHGKMPGGPGVIKDEVVPLIPYINYGTIPGLLQELSDKTNVKWFQVGAKWWLHALDFHDHQDLRADRLGSDDLPSWPGLGGVLGSDLEALDIVDLMDYSGTTPGLLPDSPSRAEGLKVRREEESQNQSLIGGGSGTTSRARNDEPSQSPPPEDDEEVLAIKALHLRTCGLTSVPPLPLVREILGKGIPVERIRDVYQTHGGDIQCYRQRNIVERLQALRDGIERAPPGPRKGGSNASQRRQEATFRAARDFAGGD